MNAQPSLLARTLVATLSFALMAAVPLLTVQYAVSAHAETKAADAPKAQCPRQCSADNKAACPQHEKGCAERSSCAGAGCAKK